MTTYTVGGGMPGPVPQPYQTVALPEQAGTWGIRQPVVEEALRHQAAALLQHTYRWLDAASAVAPQVLGVVPDLVTAVQLYEAQQYPACLNQVQAVIGVLQQARWAFPALPPL